MIDCWSESYMLTAHTVIWTWIKLLERAFVHNAFLQTDCIDLILNCLLEKSETQHLQSVSSRNQLRFHSTAIYFTLWGQSVGFTEYIEMNSIKILAGELH